MMTLDYTDLTLVYLNILFMFLQTEANQQCLNEGTLMIQKNV